MSDTHTPASDARPEGEGQPSFSWAFDGPRLTLGWPPSGGKIKRTTTIVVHVFPDSVREWLSGLTAERDEARKEADNHCASVRGILHTRDLTQAELSLVKIELAALKAERANCPETPEGPGEGPYHTTDGSGIMEWEWIIGPDGFRMRTDKPSSADIGVGRLNALHARAVAAERELEAAREEAAKWSTEAAESRGLTDGAERELAALREKGDADASAEENRDGAEESVTGGGDDPILEATDGAYAVNGQRVVGVDGFAGVALSHLAAMCFGNRLNDERDARLAAEKRAEEAEERAQKVEAWMVDRDRADRKAEADRDRLQRELDAVRESGVAVPAVLEARGDTLSDEAYTDGTAALIYARGDDEPEEAFRMAGCLTAERTRRATKGATTSSA